jgi:mannitol/fructose-specific phosphotransferase system IIA component (Ntr-type)
LLGQRLEIDSLVSRDREGVLAEFAEFLVKNALIKKKEKADVVADLLKREEKGTTGIGGGMAIPHAHFEGVKEIVFVVGRSEAGVEFNALDGMAVKVLFLLVAPPKLQEDYLYLLSLLSRVLNNREWRKFILAARSASSIYDTLIEAAQSFKS